VTTGAPSAASFHQLPLSFVENRGQLDAQVGYYVPAHGTDIYFTGAGLTYALTSRGESQPAGDEQQSGSLARPARWIVKADFVGADSNARPVGLDRTDATFNYFKGRPDEWVTAVPSYRGVTYADLWPGVDVIYGQQDGHLKYDLVLQPGADPAPIAIAYRGATDARLTESGDVLIGTALGNLVERAPYAYQEVDGQRVDVPASFTLESDPDLGQHVIGYRLGSYDPSRPLTIDPAVIVYAGYIGGDANDEGMAIAVDGGGNAYVAGQTNQPTTVPFPATVGPDLTFNGGSDAFVAKVKADGTGLAYAGYIGGTGGDGGFTITGGMGIAVDAGGTAVVTGRTQSSVAQGFPITAGAFDNTLGGTQDAFVAKVKPDGTSLIYATYLGGAGNEEGIAIALDNAGNAYVTGVTDSPAATFPVTGTPAQPNLGGGEDGFVAKLNVGGTALLYAGYIGGVNNDRGRGIAVDAANNAYVVGTTASPAASFPDTVGPATTLNGGTDAFVAKVSPNGQSFIYAGYIGGTKDEEGLAVAVDRTCTTACNAYVAGKTQSLANATEKFPALVGPSLLLGGLDDGFVAKVKGDGSGLVYAGYIGGTQIDVARGIAVDHTGAAYLTGDTSSSPAQNFPATNAPTLAYGGAKDAFVAKVKPDGSGFSFAGYIGGSGAGDIGFGIALDSAGLAYIVGYTDSSQATFPVKTGPSTTFVGGAALLDTFVAKIASAADVSITKTDSPDPATVGQPLTYTLAVSNAGPLPATNVAVSDTLLPGADFGSATPSQGACTLIAATRTVSCPLGTIAAGGTANVTLIVTPNQPGTYNNTATVSLSEDDGNTSNNTASASTTVNAVVTLCSPRPPVRVSVVAAGAGRVRATILANNTTLGNELRQIRFGTATNATVIAGSQSGAGNFTVSLPGGTQQFQFDVQRGAAGQAATAHLVVADACGDWPTFVGLGTSVP